MVNTQFHQCNLSIIFVGGMMPKGGIQTGKYTVTTFLTALNLQLANNGVNNFLGITVTYSDITSKFTFTCPHTYTLGLSAASTMNNCVGFLNGAIANSYTTQTGTWTTISTT